MALTSQASGSQTLTNNAQEYTLNSASFTSSGTYVLTLDFNDLANGEDVWLRIYHKVKSDGTERLAYSKLIQNAQSIPVFISDPVPSLNSVKFTLTQVTGSGAVVVWEIATL